MKKILFFILFTNVCFSQKRITVLDSISKKPISYTSIWDNNIHYKTADSLGVFIVDETFKSKTIKITALGFEDKNANLLVTKIYLAPKTILLNEVRITKRKNENKLKLGKVKKNGALMCLQYDSKSGIVAKFFRNSKQENIYLDKIKLYSNTSTKNRIFEISIFSVNENGEPDKILNTENIIARPKKGTSVNTIDVSDLNILFPKEGIFVAINYMLLEQNKNFDTDSNHPQAFFYEPCFYLTNSEVYRDTWYFKDAKWNKNSKYSLNLATEFGN